MLIHRKVVCQILCIQKFTYIPEVIGTSEARATSRFIFPRSEVSLPFHLPLS